jgi:hypothetical protein
MKLPVCEKSRVRGDGAGYVFTLKSSTVGCNITASTETNTKSRADINTGIKSILHSYWPFVLLCPIYVSVFSKLYFALIFQTHKNPDNDKIWNITNRTDQTVIWFSANWRSKYNILTNDRQYFILPIWRKIAMFEVLYVLPACPSYKSSIEINMTIAHWWKNRNIRRNP